MSTTNFLQSFIQFTDGTEIPDKFALWSGLSAVSCVLGRKVWFDQGGVFTLFPNTFIVLVAGSGRCRKSTSINLMERMVSGMNNPPNLISQKITPEGLIEAMGDGIKNKEKTNLLKPTVKPKNSTTIHETCEGFVVADELITFLNKKTYEAGMGPLLIQLYDCKDNYEYRTRGRGVEVIQKSCLGVFGGATIETLRQAIPEEAIGEGLTSRIIFVYVDTPAPPVPRIQRSDERARIQEYLIRELQVISDLKGEMRMSEEAWELQDTIYCNFHATSELFDMRALSGYASRRQNHLIKIAMLLAATEKSLVISPRHLQGALTALIDVEENLSSVIRQVSASDKGEETEAVCRAITKAGSMSRSDLLRRMSHRLDAKSLTEIIQTLTESKRIVIRLTSGTILYEAQPNNKE